ncbi:hypothetical protein CRYUN_Cryun13aG0036000 [Craigia yunnanensis]
MHVFPSKMMCQVPLCPSWLLWQQSCVPLLQQLEDQAWRTQMPLINSFDSYYYYLFLSPLNAILSNLTLLLSVLFIYKLSSFEQVMNFDDQLFSQKRKMRIILLLSWISDVSNRKYIISIK